MNSPILLSSRRAFLSTIALGATAWTVPGAFADELVRTPAQTEGPFYPDKLPLDTDNDLIIVNDSITPAVGTITHLNGRILDAKGNPLNNALVEIWQCDNKGIYLHSDDSTAKKRDTNFQGFGRFLTSSKGEYYFRTIKPVPYPGRPAPHIHVKLKQGGRELLTTQINIAGHPGNEVDHIVREGLAVFDRELLMADFKPLKGSKTGELTANFDIILGRTPDERSSGRGKRS
jgi:protocatechuate 3,4-dioxygenase, beta subunit